MRPWMKMLAIAGVLGVALGVTLANEKPAERRISVTPKNVRPPRLEFISRNDASVEHAGDLSVATTDHVAEELAAEVSAAPKRFSRTATDSSGKSAPKSTSKTTLKPMKGTTGDAGGLSELKQSSRTGNTPLKPLLHDVELLSPPDSEVPPQSSIKRKLVAKKVPTVIQQAGFSGKPKETIESTDEETTDGIVVAEFQQRPSENPTIQPVRPVRDQIAPPIDHQQPKEALPVSQPRGVSIVSDRTPKPLPAAKSFSRSTTTVDASSFSSNSPTIGTPSVSVEWAKQGEINVGQECACELLVKNSGKVAAREVIVEAIFPASVRLTQANPKPTMVSDHLEWSIPVLAAGEERTIHITMIPSQRGDLSTTANVRFTGTAASVFTVAEPLLQVSTKAPAEVIVGDPLVQTVTVTNPGTGIAHNVTIHIAAPEGLEATRGDRSKILIGALNPGDSRTVRLSFTAISGGDQTLEVAATADSGLNHSAEATVNVIAPSLALAVEGPAVRYAGRDARYSLSITNEGQAATNDVRVTHRIPKGFTFVKADKGGTHDAKTNSVNWTVGHLEPAQVAQLKLQLHATEIGQFEHHVSASDEHGVTAKADTTTTVEGSATLVLEIHDLDDPVEVGQETAYEVRISNTGSKPAQNVGLTFELPRGVELLNVQSVTQHLAKNGLILFNDLPELAPGKTALVRIHIRGVAEGQQRVRARLSSESIEQELITEEITKFTAE